MKLILTFDLKNVFSAVGKKRQSEDVNRWPSVVSSEVYFGIEVNEWKT